MASHGSLRSIVAFGSIPIPKITRRFGELDPSAVRELRRLPCIPYERPNPTPPKFGVLRDIVKRQGQGRIEYEIQPVEPFLSAENLATYSFELGIGSGSLRGLTGRLRMSPCLRSSEPRGSFCLDGYGIRREQWISQRTFLT